eukprot:IDg1838t1
MGKRQAYDVQFKKQVIKWYLADRNRSVKDAARHFNLDPETVKSFYRRREMILKSDDTRKKMRAAFFPDLEKDVENFVRLARSLRLPVTGNAIQLKERSLRSAYGISEEQFQASRGWLHKFLARSGIGGSIRLHGEAGDVDEQKVRGEMLNVCRKLSKYLPEHVYNEDETGFVYQCLPNITYLAPDETKKEARGSKAMRQKERITLATCTNADGSHVLPPFIIGKSKKPVCFALSKKEDQLEKYYMSNKTAWMTGELFNYYIESIWYPAVRRRTSQDVCILLDNCSAHGDNLPRFPGVEYIFLPPNVTSVYQPLDMGVLRALKTNARRHLLSQIMTNLESYNELYELGKLQKRGMRGIMYCHPAHVLDAIRAVHHAYSLLKPQHVAKCWMKTGALSPHQQAPSFQNPIASDNEDSITFTDESPDSGDFESEITKWLAGVAVLEDSVTKIVDKDPASIVAIVDDVQEMQEREEAERIANENASKRRENEAEMLRVTKESYKALLESERWLETVVKEAQKKNLDDDLYAKLVDTLRLAKVKSRTAAPSKKQRSIGDFFKSQ